MKMANLAGQLRLKESREGKKESEHGVGRELHKTCPRGAWRMALCEKFVKFQRPKRMFSGAGIGHGLQFELGLNWLIVSKFGTSF